MLTLFLPCFHTNFVLVFFLLAYIWIFFSYMPFRLLARRDIQRIDEIRYQQLFLKTNFSFFLILLPSFDRLTLVLIHVVALVLSVNDFFFRNNYSRLARNSW